MVAGNGIQGFSGDGGPATSASLGEPDGVAVDAAGNLYIADTNVSRIRKVSPGGVITTVAGGACCDLGDGGPATSASLFGPSGVAVDPAGNRYIGDQVNDRIRKVVVATPSFSVSPASLSFSAPAGTPLVASQQVAVSSLVAGVAWSAEPSTESGGPWLVLAPTSGTVSAASPMTVPVVANVGGLAAGVYSGSARVESATTGESQTVAVTLLLAQVAQTILVSQSGLLFTGVEGDGVVPSQSFGNIGQDTMSWTVRAVPLVLLQNGVPSNTVTLAIR